MATDPLDLWPVEIQVAPWSPLRLLRHQAERLSEKTQGRLTVEIISANTAPPVAVPEEWEATTVHRFELVAQALNGYRHQLVVCVHQQKFVYPVMVISGAPAEFEDGELAASQDEFMRIMKEILNSKRTVGLVSSLLARIAETGTTAVPA